MKNSKGFTLLEMLVALAISAVIIMGTYAMFDSVMNTKEAAGRSNETNVLLINMRRLVKNDLLQLYKDSLKIDNSGENSEITFTTHNSIKLERSVPVEVKYFVEDGWLVREETSDSLGYEWRLRLLPDVSDFLTLSHNGYRFTEDFDKSDTIIQISLYHGKEPYKFIAGCGLISESAKESTE